jgi:large repetitive protein
VNYAGAFGASRADQSSIDYVNAGLSTHEGDVGAFTVSDAHLLFSGNYERVGRDLIISDQMHHLVVPNYFQGDKRLLLLSPDGVPLDSAIVDALTGHTQYAQAGGSPAGKVVGHIAKMTGSASIVRNGVTIDVQVGDAVYQSTYCKQEVHHGRLGAY